MAQFAVIQAVSDTLAANWTHTPIVGLNENTEDTVLTNYVEVSFPLARARKVSVGTRAFREEGTLRLLLAVERGIGLTRPAQWADELARLFNYQSIGGVEFKEAQSPQYDETNDEGPYFMANVLVRYTYEYGD